jgi:hypothetical protein
MEEVVGAIPHKHRNQQLTRLLPPAEPGALRLLASQNGLIATGEKQKQQQKVYSTTGSAKTKATAGGILREFSTSGCSPA